jgi:hypothetical protein
MHLVAGAGVSARDGEQRDLLALEDIVSGLACGPSAVMTRNLASGNLSPTLMVIVNSPYNVQGCLKAFSGGWETVSRRLMAAGPE